MCTVTFTPAGNGFILSSNRDELTARPARPPQKYTQGDQVLLYPRDEQSQGTWIGAGSKGLVACLLNGAYQRHEKQACHTHSRGLVVLECLQQKELAPWLLQTDLGHTEPFTLLHFSFNSCWCGTLLVWDGKEKNISAIDMSKPSVWSSATLYSGAATEAKINAFNQLNSRGLPTAAELIAFHTAEQNIYSAMGGALRTVSISQLHCTPLSVLFEYRDLLTVTLTCSSLTLNECVTV